MGREALDPRLPYHVTVALSSHGLDAQRCFCNGKCFLLGRPIMSRSPYSSSVWRTKGVPAKGKAFLQKELGKWQSPYHTAVGRKGVTAKGKAFLQKEVKFSRAPYHPRSSTKVALSSTPRKCQRRSCKRNFEKSFRTKGVPAKGKNIFVFSEGGEVRHRTDLIGK
jgi:hypothetical protein